MLVKSFGKIDLNVKYKMPDNYKGIYRLCVPNYNPFSDDTDGNGNIKYGVTSGEYTKSLINILYFRNYHENKTNENYELIIARNLEETIPTPIEYISLGYEVVNNSNKSQIAFYLNESQPIFDEVKQSHISKLNEYFLFSSETEARNFIHDFCSSPKKKSLISKLFYHEVFQIMEILLVKKVFFMKCKDIVLE